MSLTDHHTRPRVRLAWPPRELSAEIAEHHARQLEIVRTTDALLDADLVVDDARRDVQAACEVLRRAVRDRAALVARLMAAIDTEGPAA